MLLYTPKFIGARVKRREDPALVQGAGRYVDDFVLPRMLHLAILRSPHAHAKIRKITIERAAALPGVVLVLTGRELEGQVELPVLLGIPPGTKVPRRPFLATEEANYVGEPVAAVVAEDRYVAADALDLLEVQYEPLAPVVDPEAAPAPKSPRVHSEFPDNVALRQQWETGDVAGAFQAEVYDIFRRRKEMRRSLSSGGISTSRIFRAALMVPR